MGLGTGTRRQWHSAQEAPRRTSRSTVSSELLSRRRVAEYPDGCQSADPRQRHVQLAVRLQEVQPTTYREGSDKFDAIKARALEGLPLGLVNGHGPRKTHGELAKDDLHWEGELSRVHRNYVGILGRKTRQPVLAPVSMMTHPKCAAKLRRPSSPCHCKGRILSPYYAAS